GGTTVVATGNGVWRDIVAPNSDVTSAPEYTNTSSTPIEWTAGEISGDGEQDSGLAEVVLWVKTPDSSSWTSTSYTSSVSGGTFDYEPLDGDGIYTFTSVATDNVGNVETIPSNGGVSTFYDVISPTAILTPLATYQTSVPFLVQWNGDDPTPSSGIASYEIQYCDVDPCNANDWQVWSDVGDDPTDLDADFTGNDGDTYTFRVRAYDTAGNEGAWSTGITTTIDATAPESQVSAPANSQTADFEVTWSGSDATSGIVSYDVQYKDGDGAWTGW
ncbi:MAG: hypothetical protein GY720_08500, partial [bacterium]|nr:hypothetical protein [bacterium]